jgi:CRP/FNR family transcriptional regulator, cyclic AMP receptor protein
MKNLTLIDKAFFLKRSIVFNTLDLDLLLAIADKVLLIAYHPGEYIFSLEEHANRMYFIISGEVAIYTQNHQLIARLGSGDFFGEESLFNDQPRGYSAFCSTETNLLTLSRTNLYTIISECPSVALGFLKSYTAELTFRPFSKQEET